MKIDRRSGLATDQFVADYLVTNRPAIITDAMAAWNDWSKWGPDYLNEELGGCDVQVYDNLFDLVDLKTMAEYLEENFGKPAGSISQEYVRWYTKFKEADFVWADEAFERIRKDWDHPYFLPSTSYVVPFCQPPNAVNAAETLFPYKGLFVSGAGARTRLHRDPWSSDAVLCQLYGSKALSLYAPDQDHYLQNGKDFVDPQSPDLEKFPHFKEARLSYEDVLEPGEVLYIPGGWLHDVQSLTDSISVTWNFVHGVRLDAFCKFMQENPSEKDLEVIRFFLRPWVAENAKREEIFCFLNDRFRNGAAA